ncbi:hypothetical protein GPROT1_03961 [Gammaproteobacteria bacterium]|nr:hypothetical protein GPROT1_03961 [Gammaproteobacteria bacterium]
MKALKRRVDLKTAVETRNKPPIPFGKLRTGFDRLSTNGLQGCRRSKQYAFHLLPKADGNTL